MDRTTLVPLLQRAPFFRLLDAPQILHVLASALSRRVQRGEVLCRRAEPGDSVIVLAAGRLSAAAPPVASTSPPVAELGPGAVTGEMCCLEPGPRKSTLTALEDSQVLLLTHSLFRSLQLNSPEIAVNIVSGVLTHLVQLHHENNRRLENLLVMPGRGPVSMVLPRARRRAADAQLGVPNAGTPHRGALDLGPLRAARGLSERELDLLAAIAPPIRYPDRALLCREGGRGSSCFLIAQGAVQIIKELVQIPRVIATVSAGAMVGQMSLIEQQPQPTTLRAQGEVVVLDLAREHFEKLLRAHSSLGIRFQDQVACSMIRQLRAVADRTEAILMQTASARGGSLNLSPRQPGPRPGLLAQAAAPAPAPAAPPAEARPAGSSLSERLQRLVELWRKDPEGPALQVLTQDELDAAIILAGRSGCVLGQGLDVTATLRLLAMVGGHRGSVSITQTDVLRGMQKVEIARLALRNRALYDDDDEWKGKED